MKCPKCEHELEVVSFNDIEVDRCTNCMGIWFDHHEQDALKQLQGAENIDIGDEFVGAKH
jgi:Zn-finger nucleic acid-binding protein